MTNASNLEPAASPATIAPPGLKGLIVADTAIGSVRGAEGFFHYRHHNAAEVAQHHTFEAIAALLLDGDLPTADGESAFRAALATARHVEPHLLAWLRPLAESGMTPLAGLGAAIPQLAADTATLDLSPAERRTATLRVAAAMPTVLAAFHRLGQGLDPLAADPGLGHAADYIRMITGSTPPARVSRAVEIYLNLTADHGFNASTFTTRVVTSTGASVPAIMASAVAALSGPLHGGAPSRVLDMLDDIGDPANTEKWAQRQLDQGNKIMGFGHAVYRADDPRSTVLREVALGLGGEVVAQAVEVERRMLAALRQWKPSATIVTNVEFYACVVMHLAGIPQEMFTPTFTSSRAIGWSAHLLEQAADNKIMRPSARYVGPAPTGPTAA